MTTAEIETAGRRLIVEYRRGEITKNWAFELLIGLIEARITNFLRVKFCVVDDEQLSDLFQTFILTFYDNESAYDDQRPLLPYLWTLARNVKSDFLRGKNREKRDGQTRRIENVQDDKGDGGMSAAALEGTILIEEALSSLSSEDREIVCLYYAWDYTLQEVAAILSLRVSTIQGRIRRSKKKLEDYGADRRSDLKRYQLEEAIGSRRSSKERAS